jgi:hypothetical protein
MTTRNFLDFLGFFLGFLGFFMGFLGFLGTGSWGRPPTVDPYVQKLIFPSAIPSRASSQLGC